MAMTIDMTGKTVLLTGAGRGLGKEMALVLADCGADVFLGNRKEGEGRETVQEIEKMGRRAGFRTCDVAKAEDVERLVQEAVKFGGGTLDVFINAAGVVSTEDMMVIKDDEVKRLFEINVLGTSHAIQSGLRQMMGQRSGNIITVSSIAGRTNMGVLQHYCASKAAVISLTQAGAKAGAPHGVRVNSIAPGIIRTAMWEEILDGMASDWNGREAAKIQSPEEREKNWEEFIQKFIPLGRPQQAEDIAWATAFLVSDYAREITGQVLTIDGGTTMV